LHRRSFSWLNALRSSARYVFNRLLTADEAAVALTNGARQLDIDWVIWVGEG
jgi:hypothetical protein